MRFYLSILGISLWMAVAVGRGQEPALQSPPVHPSEKNGQFVIHLQGGFTQGHEAIIQVDGREVYRGVPKTSPALGLAKQIPVQANSSHPVVTLTMPETRIHWSKDIDLSAGRALGISVGTNGIVTFHQAKNFLYD